MTADAPEYHTKASTPISPLPVHPPSPSSIPVLENQIDPVFNMTSTHLDPPTEETMPSLAPAAEPAASTAEAPAEDNSSVDHSSFSDPFEEPDQAAQESAPALPVQSTEEDDNYAMTFDSDGEAKESDSQEISKAVVDQEKQSTPPPASVPIAENSTSIANNTSAHALPSPDPSSSVESPSQNASSSIAPEPQHVVQNGNAAPAVPASEQPQAPLSDPANDGIDIQQLLDNITANAANNAVSAGPTPAVANGQRAPTQAGAALPAHASLPPRPQTLENPPMHHAYPPQNDIRHYHQGPSAFPSQNAPSYGPPGGVPPAIAAGAPGTVSDPRTSLAPPPATFQPHSNAPPGGGITPAQLRAQLGDASEPSDPADRQWDSVMNARYDDFLKDERMYVTEGLWDRFPMGSRLFIGNLPTEKVTKRDLFHVFHKYGRLAQISIKQAYGFVQFHDSPACYRALEKEQGAEVRGRKMHLEISKPQKNDKKAAGNAAAQGSVGRRSRSPDPYGRNDSNRGARGSQNGGRGGYDRYDARQASSPRDGDFRGPFRGGRDRERDDYRPRRSPTPPRGGGFRGRDDYGPRGRDGRDERDYYDNRRRSRSRSPPYGRRNYRDRSPSPRSREMIDDAELKIPRRLPRDVPDVQIILMDELDRNFINWVDDLFRARSLRTEIMFLHPRTPLSSVLRRQILEGVQAVTQLERRSQDTGRIPLTVFDRKGGADVRFDEYQDLDPKIAAELVVRAKATAAAAVYPQYAAAPPPASYGQQAPVQAQAPANLSNAIGQLDNNTIQKILGALSNPAQTTQQAPAAAPVDLNAILNSLTGQQQPQQAQNQAPRAQDPYAAIANNPALASILGGGSAHMQQPQQQTQQQVQSLMAHLAKYPQ